MYWSVWQISLGERETPTYLRRHNGSMLGRGFETAIILPIRSAVGGSVVRVVHGGTCVARTLLLDEVTRDRACA